MQKLKGEKRPETVLTASILKKRSKTHKRLKEHFLNWTKWDKMSKKNFRKSSFSSYVQHKNKQLIQLILCQLHARRLAEGKWHETDPSNWHKISWINCLFFCFYVVRSSKKRTSSKMCTFRPVSSNSKSVLLISRVFWIFFFHTFSTWPPSSAVLTGEIQGWSQFRMTGKMEETGCEIIRGAPTTLVFKR